MSSYERVMGPAEGVASTPNIAPITDADRTALRAMSLPRPQRRAVARDLGMTSPAMHQRAVHLLADPDAERAMPLEVHRLRRVRDKWRLARGGL